MTGTEAVSVSWDALREDICRAQPGSHLFWELIREAKRRARQGATMMFYILICRQCGNGDLVMPFDSAEARGKWAGEHTRATGHDQWFVKDVPSSTTSDGWI